MRREDLDCALGATPQTFIDRMDQTLRELKEEKEVKRLAWSTIAAFALIALLLCTTAFAVVRYGLDWYYNNRFTAYQQYEPEKHEAIMNHLQTEVPQSNADDPEISIVVAETSWAPEQNVLVVSIAASPADPSAAELHPMWNLDADGSYVGKENLELYQDDAEARGEHWLWTENGFGPVEDMVEKDKQLLLFRGDNVFLEDLLLLGDMSSYDAYVSEDGVVHTVLEISMADYFDPDYAGKVQEQIEQFPENKDYFEKRLVDVQRFRQILAEDEDGVITLRFPYTVTLYTDDDQQLYNGGREGEIQFEVKFR